MAASGLCRSNTSALQGLSTYNHYHSAPDTLAKAQYALPHSFPSSQTRRFSHCLGQSFGAEASSKQWGGCTFSETTAKKPRRCATRCQAASQSEFSPFEVKCMSVLSGRFETMSRVFVNEEVMLLFHYACWFGDK